MMESGNGSGNMYMPVAPAYGGGGFGNGFGVDALWFLLFFCIMGGWGNNGYGANAGGGGLYPWMNQSNQINDGFRDQMINGNITGIQQAVTSGFGDVQLGIAGINQNICQTGNGIVAAVNNGFSQAEIAANGRQMANMQAQFGMQGQIAQFAADTRLGSCQTQNTIVSDGAQTRETIRSGNQAILDKLCQLELDGVKQNAETRYAALEARYNQALSENQALRFERSQTAQNGLIQQGFANEVDQLYNRLNSCPVPTTPVYGRTPIFTCNSQNGGCGCGGNGFLN